MRFHGPWALPGPTSPKDSAPIAKKPVIGTDDDRAEVAGLFDRWNAALATGDPKAVAALYASDGVLLPTVSNKVRTTPEEIEDYFAAFLQLQPQGVINESSVRILAEGTAIHSGVYTFDIVRDGTPQEVEARFSFTYKKIDGEWLIVDHHSSGMPEGPVKPPVDPEAAEVAALFDRWNAALQTGDPKAVAALYAPTAVLLPTVSNKVRTTPAEIEDYFSAFLQLKPYGTIEESSVRLLAKDTAIHSGVYTFDIVRDGRPEEVQARFSFTYKKINGEWLIVDHHSSGMPEGDRTAAEVAALFDRWNAALATGDPKAVAALYAPTAVLLPTVSNKVRTTPAEIEDYFATFLQLKPCGTIDEASVRLLAKDTAIHSGVYTFDIVKEGSHQQVQARFSFTYKKINGDWLIVDHHSSGMPEGDRTSAEVAGLFDRWNAALATGDPKAVAALYAPTAVLLPTVSNKVRTSPEEIEDYFAAFLQLQPQGTIDESNVRLLAKDTAIHSGVYTFDIVRDGTPQQVQARFSFTYKKIGGEWLIIDHHSSGMPEGDRTSAEVAALFDRWNAALATGDPKAVAALYAPTAVLLPTVSNKVRTSPEEIEDYFAAFLQLQPQGAIDSSNVRLLAKDTAIHSGVYTFDIVRDGTPQQVQARFSFTYKKIGGEWLIVDHHSSGMPEGAPAPAAEEAAPEVQVAEDIATRTSASV
ncbi:MAG: hypothetical protein J3K34DRAFT_517475 [Monoraphidium minutum]|nr:MAG: hypothetical protein J3K34DRAFT_517475 [Monoraphidium minutum]